jgi:hypothetical protein
MRPRADSALAVLIAAAGFCLIFMGLAATASVTAAAVALVTLVVAITCLRSAYMAAALLVAAMLFSPEFQLAEGARLRAEDLIIPMLGVTLAARACIPRFRITFRWCRLDGAILFLVGVNTIASLRGAFSGMVSPLSSLLWNGKIIEQFMIYWLVYNYVRDDTQIRRLLVLGLIVLLAVTAYTFTQIPGTAIFTTRRLTAPFEGNPEPTTLGGYLILLLAIVMALGLYDPERRRRWLWWGISLLVLVPILFTLSRTTYVSCLVMVFALALVTGRRDLLFFTILLLCLSPLILPDKIVERVLMTMDSSRELGIDQSAAERVFVWRKAAVALQTHPFLGYGIPQFILDSQFARILVESGTLGLAGWFAVFGVCLHMGWHLHRRARNPFHRALAAGYIVGTLSLQVHALATITFYIVRIMEPYWFLTGIIATLYTNCRRSEAEAARAGETPAPE